MDAYASVAGPAPFEVVNAGGGTPVLIICDHASRVVPEDYDRLGLDETLLLRHIAWDIGAGDVARRLAALLDAPAVLCGTSRLVIDCNRALDDATSIPPASDGIAVPGNRDLDAAERRRRAERHFQPYHGEIRRRLDGFRARGIAPTLLSVHSFTPVMDGFERPWHVGLLWDRDPALSRALIAELGRNPNLVVGDNEPYSGSDPQGYAIATYGTGLDLPMAVFEIRQDLIDTHHGAESWAHLLHAALRPVLRLG
jgi:predicted N-formylglutamate amidohydrolase